jgi:hypothetical protein
MLSSTRVCDSLMKLKKVLGRIEAVQPSLGCIKTLEPIELHEKSCGIFRRPTIQLLNTLLSSICLPVLSFNGNESSRSNLYTHIWLAKNPGSIAAIYLHQRTKALVKRFISDTAFATKASADRLPAF